MAFVGGADVIALVRNNSPINNGSFVILIAGGRGDPAPSGTYQKINPQVNRYAESGLFYVRAHKRFFPQFLMVTSGNYDYSNG